MRYNNEHLLDELLKPSEETSNFEVSDKGINTAVELPISLIDSFPAHPFKVVNDEAMQELVQSIRDNGLIMPAIVRKKEDGRYELISGHRRKMACELAGFETIAVMVKELDKDAAIITMVDSNMQRESILPSEKAFAYKMKLEAIKHQGKTSRQLGEKWSVEIVGDTANESARQIHRYVCLTNLVLPLLELVDGKRIAFNPAIELSYLTKSEQHILLSAFQSEEATPSLSQAQRLKKLSQEGNLDGNKIFEILNEEKANQKEQIKFKKDTIEKFFPQSYTSQQIEETILTLLEQWQRNRERNRDSR